MIVLVETIGLRAEYGEYHRNHVYERSWVCAQTLDGHERHPAATPARRPGVRGVQARFKTGLNSKPDPGLITFDTELRLVCAPSLRDHFAEATVSRN